MPSLTEHLSSSFNKKIRFHSSITKMEIVKKVPKTTCSKFLTKLHMTDIRKRVRRMRGQHSLHIFLPVVTLPKQGMCCWGSHLTGEARPTVGFDDQ